MAIFFAGLGLGGRIWGALTSRLEPPLRVFGLLELAVALSALGHFFLLDAYHAVYPALYAATGDTPILDTLLKAGIATVILLPPAFLMGGTLPFMTAHLVPMAQRLGAGGRLTPGATPFAFSKAEARVRPGRDTFSCHNRSGSIAGVVLPSDRRPGISWW